MLGALIVTAILAQAQPPPYPTPAERRAIILRIRAADRDFAGGEHEPSSARAALAKDVTRLLDEARRRGLRYDREAAARRDVVADPPWPRPGIPMPIDGRLAKLSIHAARLLRLLDSHPAPEAPK